MSMPDFRKGQVENSGENWKNAQFPRVLKGDFYHLSLNGKNTPHFTILSQNTPSDLKIELEN